MAENWDEIFVSAPYAVMWMLPDTVDADVHDLLLIRGGTLQIHALQLIAFLFVCTWLLPLFVYKHPHFFLCRSQWAYRCNSVPSAGYPLTPSLCAQHGLLCCRRLRVSVEPREVTYPGSFHVLLPNSRTSSKLTALWTSLCTLQWYSDSWVRGALSAGVSTGLPSLWTIPGNRMVRATGSQSLIFPNIVCMYQERIRTGD